MNKYIVLLFCAFLCLSLNNTALAERIGDEVGNYSIDRNAGFGDNHVIQSSLRASENWQNFRAENGSWYVDFNQRTGFPRRAAGEAIQLNLAAPEVMAQEFINNHLSVFDYDFSVITLRNVNTTDKFHYVHFTQEYLGHPILWSELTVRITLDGKVPMFGMDVHPSAIEINLNPTISAEEALAASVEDLNENIIEGTGVVDPQLKIYPVPAGNSYVYRLVYEVECKTEGNSYMPGWYFSYIDAETGQILNRQNKVCSMNNDLVLEGQISGSVSKNFINQAQEQLPMPYVEIEVDGQTYNTDENGMFNLEGNDPAMATVRLRGEYCQVRDQSLGGTIPSFQVELQPGYNTITFDGSNAKLTATSVYRAVNIIHDTLKTHVPAFNGLDFPFIANVEVSPIECNAFYDGEINFFQNGSIDGECYSLALFEDVVYHEYGHGINFDLYNFYGGFFSNGALGEGYSDVWGIYITGNPILSEGAFIGNPASYIRNYSEAPKVYPADLIGQVHADGEIICGAWLDVAVNLNDSHKMFEIFVETQAATVNAADGQEGTLYRNILLEALIADDDNADINDGTPNDVAILDAFARHGITLIGNIELEHTEVLSAAASVPVSLSTDVTVDFPVYLGDVTVWYRTDDTQPFTSQVMPNASGNTFTTEIASFPIGTIVEYYFTVNDIYGAQALTIPFLADDVDNPNLPFFLMVGFEQTVLEDFDNQFGGWEFDFLGVDDASTGQWGMTSPNASFQTEAGFIVQTGTDHTPNDNGNLCMVTENGNPGDAYNLHDVDNGATSIVSPIFNMTDYDDPAFSYWRWYSNRASANPGNDYWKVFITNDGTDWVPVERTNVEDVSWRRNVIRVSDYVAPGNYVRLMFIAEDSVILNQGLQFDGGSIVEAALDDLGAYDLSGVTEAPDASFEYTDSELDIDLFDTSNNGVDEWFWDFGDGNTSTEQNPSYTFATDGTYTVCLTVTNAIGSDTVCEDIAVMATNISTYQQSFEIYPNPVKDYFVIQTSERVDGMIQIHNATGQLMESFNAASIDFTKGFDVGSYDSGLYFISLEINGEMIRDKFVIE